MQNVAQRNKKIEKYVRDIEDRVIRLNTCNHFQKESVMRMRKR